MPLKKYQILPNAPAKFAIHLPGYGVNEFITENLTEHEAEALFKADWPFIKEAKEPKEGKGAAS